MLALPQHCDLEIWTVKADLWHDKINAAAEEAAADAKKRAGEARKWIDNWKSKQ